MSMACTQVNFDVFAEYALVWVYVACAPSNLGSPGSTPKAMAGNPSVTKFIQRICTAVNAMAALLMAPTSEPGERRC